MKTEVIVRRDRLGRITLSKENIENLLKLYDASHESAQSFAKKHGIKYPTLAHWIQQRRRKRPINKEAQSSQSIPTTFAVSEITLPVKEEIVIEMGPDIRIYFSSQNQMELVLELFESLRTKLKC